MNWLNSFIVSISAAAICIGALYIICPTGKISKSVNYIFSMCFLLIVISSAGISVKKSDIDFKKIESIVVDNRDIDISTAKFVYGNILKNAGIVFEEINIITDISDNSGIVISRLEIKTKCSKQQIQNALGDVSKNFEVLVINE